MFLKFFNGRRLTVNFKCFAFSERTLKIFLDFIYFSANNVKNDV